MVKFKKGYKYLLAAPYVFRTGITGYSIVTPFLWLDYNGKLLIATNYAWDGATMFPDLKPLLRPSLIHDALCQLIRSGLLPESLLPTVHQIMRDEVIKDVAFLGNPLHYRPLAPLIYIGLMAVGKFGKGYDLAVITAP